MGVQVLLAGEEGLELVDQLLAGAGGVGDLRVVDRRDVGRIPAGDAVAVGVVAEHPTVRRAGVAAVERRHLRLVVAEERMLPGQRGLQRLGHVVVGGGLDVGVRVQPGDALVAVVGDRVGARVDVGGMVEGQAEVAEPVRREGLVQRQGEAVRLALVGIGEQGRLRAEGAVLVGQRVLRDRRLARRLPELLAAVRQHAGGCAEVHRLVEDAVAYLDVLVLRRRGHAPPQQLAIQRQAGLPHGRQAEVPGDRIDRAGAAAGRDVLVERIRTERRLRWIERVVGEQGDAVVLVRVGHPHRGR